MNHYTAILSGKTTAELDTEIKYNLAAAKINESKIIKFILPAGNNENDAARINGCVIKVLRSVKKQGSIQYFCNKSGLSSSAPEVQFIINKYSDFIEDSCDTDKNHLYYVMI